MDCEIPSVRPELRDPAVALLSNPPPLRGSANPSLHVTDFVFLKPA